MRIQAALESWDSQDGTRAVSLHLLGGVGDTLRQWSEAQQEDVSFMRFGLLELSVSPMKVVQHPQHSIALAEPGERGELQR